MGTKNLLSNIEDLLEKFYSNLNNLRDEAQKTKNSLDFDYDKRIDEIEKQTNDLIQLVKSLKESQYKISEETIGEIEQSISNLIISYDKIRTKIYV